MGWVGRVVWTFFVKLKRATNDFSVSLSLVPPPFEHLSSLLRTDDQRLLKIIPLLEVASRRMGSVRATR